MLLILGFPIALILSWAYEITPEGIKLERNIAAGESITHVTGRKFDFVIIGLLVLAVGYMFVDNYLPESGPFAGAEIDPASLEVELDEPPSISAGPTPAIAEEPQGAVLPNSVAVLPFDNLSPDPSDAFFAAGLHDEILSQLAKLRNLSVISRTSMLRYADSDLSIPEIARELNVGTVMEGSVRYSNGRVRITTQLIDAATDKHLWSETYEREFSDIFAIESDIAMNIANALEAEFSLEEQRSIEAPLTNSPEAYASYLRAITSVVDIAPLMDSSLVATFHRYLDQAIDADPDFALAHALKALEYAFSTIRTFPLEDPETQSRRESLAREQANQALLLDPDLGAAHGALGVLNMISRRGREAQAAFERAYELSPKDLNVITDFAVFSAQWGRHEEATMMIRQAMELAPGSPEALAPAGLIFLLARDYDMAAQTNRAVIRVAPTLVFVYPLLGLAEVARGNETESLEELRFAEELLQSTQGPDQLALTAYGYGLLGRANDAMRILAQLRSVAEEFYVGPGSWAAAYLSVGENDLALDWLERAAQVRTPDEGWTSLSIIGANALADPVLERPEFVEVRQQLGYSDL